MKKFFFAAGSLCLAAIAGQAQTADSVRIGDKNFLLVKHIERPIGPGCVYKRYRVPDFPLNINMVLVDVRNPWIQIETFLSNERADGTELIVDGAKRYDAPDHHAICAQNSNFWIVSSQPQWAAYGAMAHNVSMRNGIMATDSRSFPHWWWFNSMHTGIVGADAKNRLFIDQCRYSMTYSSDKLGARDFHTCNKGFRGMETAVYTKVFGPERPFIPLAGDRTDLYDVDNSADCTEVLLDMAEGESWSGGRDMKFVVSEVRRANGRGCLGEHDLAIVQRGTDLAALVPGDVVKLNYTWIFDTPEGEVRPELTQAVGGNMMVMRNGEITEQNSWDSYNTMVYSRSAYGTSADKQTLYMVTIDKSSDPPYGVSNGCTTADMCYIMKHLGCTDLINVDAGGSAELMVDNRIINRTTEGVPRAVNDGWMVFDTSTDVDSVVASLYIDGVGLRAGTNSVFTPKVIALNKVGRVLTRDYKDFTVTASNSVGTGSGTELLASDTPGTGTITVTAANGATGSADIRIESVQPSLLRTNVIVDREHPYRIDVVGDLDGIQQVYNPGRFVWKSDNEAVAKVDADGNIEWVSNGEANITANLGAGEVSIKVVAQTSPDHVRTLNANDWTGWSAKGSTGLSGMTLGADGSVKYTYGTVRAAASVTLTGNVLLYGMPQALEVEFENDIPVHYIDFGVATPASKRKNLTVKPDEPYAPGMTHTVSVRTEGAEESNDLQDVFPMTLLDVKFNTQNSAEYKGARTLNVKGVRALYNQAGGVDETFVPQASLRMQTAVAAPGETVAVSAPGLRSVQVYSLSGAVVASGICGNDGGHFTAPAVAGHYVVSAVTAHGRLSARLTVR